jgi:NTP pyrophosphatase (non-canonical NTP hydrolase)
VNIKELIKEAHDNAVEKGFYDCPECEGDGYFLENNPLADKDDEVKCDTCKGSGIDPNKNIGELLMLIVSELGEALEAHRCGRFANKEALEDILKLINGGSKMGLLAHYPQIKDTFEDEIADVLIRLFDLCGYLDLDIEKHIKAKMQYNRTRPHKHGKEY